MAMIEEFSDERLAALRVALNLPETAVAETTVRPPNAQRHVSRKRRAPRRAEAAET